jgi:hypothetical protein
MGGLNKFLSNVKKTNIFNFFPFFAYTAEITLTVLILSINVPRLSEVG